MKKLLATLVSVLALGFAASGANAATCIAVTPDHDPDASLTNSNDCGPGLGGGGNDSEADVQTASGDPLWTLVGGVGAPLFLTFTGTTGGNWFIDASAPDDTDFLIVIKDGNAGGALDIRWAWFDVDTSIKCVDATYDYCGTWTMYGGGTLKDISHMSLYSQDGADQIVPEPGTLVLLGAAMIGLAATRRQRTV